MNEEIVYYKEIQRPKSFFIITIVAGITLLMWYAFIQQIILHIPFGDNPAPNWLLGILWVVFGLLFPWGAINMKLVTFVQADGLYIKFTPFHMTFKRIPFSNITSVQTTVYNPLTRFAGWGIRFNFKGEKAYTLGGNEGIELHTINGTIVVESEHPEKLADCISKQLL